jgi:hypothetical protein
LYDPEWRLIGTDWHMIVGNRTVAALTPVSSEICPQYSWLSAFVGGGDYPDHGWDNVDFETLDDGKYHLEQWWRHVLRGEQYRSGRGAGDGTEAPALTVAAGGAGPEEAGGEKDRYLRMVMGAPEEAVDVLKNKLRANHTYEIHANVIAITDPDDGAKSVTNDAANVIADFAAKGFDLSKYRVIYRDTRGIWDEMLVGNGVFVDFRSLNERDLTAALAKLPSVEEPQQQEQRRGQRL